MPRLKTNDEARKRHNLLWEVHDRCVSWLQKGLRYHSCWLSLSVSPVAHQALAYLGFHNQL